MLQFARRQPPLENWVQITQIYFDSIQEILLGEAEAAEILGDAAQQIDGLIQR